mgnify:CR=1 FL=1
MMEVLAYLHAAFIDNLDREIDESASEREPPNWELDADPVYPAIY